MFNQDMFNQDMFNQDMFNQDMFNQDMFNQDMFNWDTLVEISYSYLFKQRGTKVYWLNKITPFKQTKIHLVKQQ